MNQNKSRRDADVRLISQADKKSFFEYYDDRDKEKIKKSEKLKENSYKDMRAKIEQNHRNMNELGKKRREDAERSVQELQQYWNDEKERRAKEKFIQKQYKDILETQVKMRSQKDKSDFNNIGISEPVLDSNQINGEMYMVPGINSVSPYVKQQRQGQPPLGEHYHKMKKYIDTDKGYSLEGLLTAQPSDDTFRNHSASKISVGEPNNLVTSNPSPILATSPKNNYSKQESYRPTVLKESGKYSLISDANLYYDPIVNPIPNLNKNKWNIQNLTSTGTRSVTEKMIKRNHNPLDHMHNRNFNL